MAEAGDLKSLQSGFESQRGHDLGKRLIRLMVDEGLGRNFRWVLFTRDAHGLYEQVGFAAPDANAMVRPAR